MDTGDIVIILIVIGSILLSVLGKKKLPENPNKPVKKVPLPVPSRIPDSILADFDKTTEQPVAIPFLSSDKDYQTSEISQKILQQEKADALNSSFSYKIEDEITSIEEPDNDAYSQTHPDIPTSSEWRKAIITSEIIKTKF